MEVEWARLKAHELRALAAQGAVVVVPVAAMEQHGPHLPVMVDSLLCGEVAARAARRAAAQRPAVVAPTVWTGLSEHHMPFGGTFTLDLATFRRLLECLCGSLARQGFRRVLLLNGHGGNVAALRVVVDELSAKLELQLLTATYWQLDPVAISEILERQSGVQHACEAETSMVMALRPELVDGDQLEPARWVEPGPGAGRVPAVYRWRSFAGRTPTGVIGDPTAASAEKGERLLEAAAAAVAEVLVSEDAWAVPARS